MLPKHAGLVGIREAGTDDSAVPLPAVFEPPVPAGCGQFEQGRRNAREIRPFADENRQDLFRIFHRAPGGQGRAELQVESGLKGPPPGKVAVFPVESQGLFPGVRSF